MDHKQNWRFSIPQNSLLRKRMIQGGLINQQPKDRVINCQGSYYNNIKEESRVIENPIYQMSKISALLISNNTSKLNSVLYLFNESLPTNSEIIYYNNENFPDGDDHIRKAELNWTSKKKHFRDTEEWKIKKARIISKIKAMGKINLAFIISKMQVSFFIKKL